MSEYEPPTANYPIFDSLVFLSPNNASITKAEADLRYLAKTGTASSVATLTSFTGDISVGSSLLDYTTGTGLSIKGTANGESIFMNVLNAGGVVKPKIELNPSHTHLYDQIRFTDSSSVLDYTTVQQSTANLVISNIVAGSTTTFKNDTSGGVSTTAMTLSSSGVSVTGETATSGLNGLTVNGAIFGRNDIVANTFSGTLGYTYHPIGWTIAVTKTVTPTVSGADINVITNGTPTTVFNTLSNGVWEIGCDFNNLQVVGTMTLVKMFYAAATGMTSINGSIGVVTFQNLFHQLTMSGTVALSYPRVLMRVTGNGTTSINVTFNPTYTVAPTLNFHIYARKVA